MADTLVNNLYPPAVETFQPAFRYTDPAYITFAISPFNAAPDIKYVHVSVTDQRNNENVLIGSQSMPGQKDSADINETYGVYNGLLVSTFPRGNEQVSGLVYYSTELDLYSISIPTNLLRRDSKVHVKEEVENPNSINPDTGEHQNSSITIDTKYFNVGQYYKVQLRFDIGLEDIAALEDLAAEAGAEGLEAQKKLQNYMIDQRPGFSEWSTVTLIKPVLPIHVNFPQFPIDAEESDIININKGLVRIAGQVYFSETAENEAIINEAYGDGRWEEDEHLQQYRLQVYAADTEGNPILTQLITDTGKVYAEPTKVNNSYEYGINHLLDLENTNESSKYVLVVELWSNNDYYYTTTRVFIIAAFASSYTAPRWHNRTEAKFLTEDMRGYIQVNQEDGVAIIDFTWDDISIPSGNLYIKRACSKDNFKQWDVISITKQTGLGTIYTHIEDYTICSLYRYRYSAQYEQKGGMWSKIYYSDIIYPKFYEMLLERQNRQIAIRYNGQITSWKPVVNRQKVDTLGGRYPKFVENAQMNYKQFAIQGLISAEEDFNRKFLNEFEGEWVYNDKKEEYEYKYYYQDDIQRYDKEFNTKYLLRNDTDPDGEFGYNPEQLININDDTYTGNYGNNYLDHEETYGHGALFNDDQYARSVFLDKKDDASDKILSANYYQHDLYPQDHWYWEREFREELIKWLNDGEPKLYRSMPEGNVAVMLTDVSLTPMTQLGRRLYQFSATLYEVGDGYSLESLDKLGIIDIPKLSAAFIDNHSGGSGGGSSSDDENEGIRIIEQVGQTYIPKIYDGTDIIGGAAAAQSSSYIWNEMSLIEQINSQYRSALKSLVVDSNSVYLYDLRIQFLSKPHWYIYKNNTWTFLSNQDINQTEENDQLYLGYKLIIKYLSGTGSNTANIFINEKGYYQVPSDTFVVGITLDGLAQDEVIIDYVLHYNQSANASLVPSRRRVLNHIVGQWGGMFPVNTYAGKSIYEKYKITQYRYNTTTGVIDTGKFINFVQTLDFWQGLGVDVTPYSLIGIRYQDSDEYQRIVVGRTGVFSILDDGPTRDIAFLGRKMFKVDRSRQPYLDDWEYVLHPSIEGDSSGDGFSTNWNDLQNSQIVESDDAVYYYYGENVENQENADATVPIGAENVPFQEWLEIHAADPVDISNPLINMVYPINIENTVKYYIYYIDNKWYPISLAADGTALAAVPVYGYINYIGDIVRSEYD